MTRQKTENMCFDTPIVNFQIKKIIMTEVTLSPASQMSFFNFTVKVC